MHGQRRDVEVSAAEVAQIRRRRAPLGWRFTTLRTHRSNRFKNPSKPARSESVTRGDGGGISREFDRATAAPFSLGRAQKLFAFVTPPIEVRAAARDAKSAPSICLPRCEAIPRAWGWDRGDDKVV